MSTLKQITTKAKVLYKTGKYKKWTDAIKAASSTISKTAKKVKKVVTKKAKVGATKKKADPKKKVAKSYHKDTKSHNVRINVVSGGMEKIAHDTIKEKESFLKSLHIALGECIYEIKNAKGTKKKELLDLKNRYNRTIKQIEKEIKYWKKYC
jgi:hypothetical protein